MFKNTISVAVFFLTFLVFSVHSQTIWNEDFSDSNYTSNPAWHGDTSLFEINSQKQLQLNAPAVSTSAHLSTPSNAAIKSSWEFWIKLEFNPSTNNYAQVFVMSSAANPNQALQGYFVEVGGSSQDRISLFKRTGNQNSLLIESQAGIVNQSTVSLGIKLDRDSLDNWTLWTDSLGGTNYQLLGTKQDSEIVASNHFIFNCIYTSTRSDKFYLDNIKVNGKAFVDNLNPTITSHHFPDWNKLQLNFSEPLDSSTAQNELNYTYQNGSNSIQTVDWNPLRPQQVALTFTNNFQNSENFGLTVKNVSDLFGNAMADTTLPLTFYRPDYRSVVLNEIMADPSPPVFLPDAEYIELYNPSLQPINLAGWKLVVGHDTLLLASHLLYPFDYVLLINAAAENLFDTLPKITLNTGSGWLKNGGEQLVLLDEKNALIDAANYNLTWYQNDAKADGGWSLEQVESWLICSEPLNWSASNAPDGGTPGTANKPEKDFTPDLTIVHSVTWGGPRIIGLEFDKSISPEFLPEITSDAPIEKTVFSPVNPQNFEIHFQNDITSSGIVIYIYDSLACQQRFLGDTLLLSKPLEASEGDLVLNEILFNPTESGSDFIEIWNISSKTFRLDELRLADVDENGDIKNAYPISAEPVLFLPNSIVSFSEQNKSVCSNYVCGKRRNYVDVSKLPSMPDNEGSIAVTSPALQKLDWVAYSNDWHHELINNQEGVSLERVHPALPTQKASSWHSAASSVNYASPGMINSQFSSSGSNKKNVWLNNNTISPNNDGSNDVLIVYYDLPIGTALTVNVLGMNGVLIHTIADNLLTDNSGQLAWDGKSNKGQIANTGIYIVLCEWFTPDGYKGISKLNLAVSR